MNELATTDLPREMSVLAEGRRLLAEAKTLDDVRLIRDQAEAIRCFLRKRNDGLETLNDATDLVIRAERKGGEILRAAPKNPGSKGIGSRVRSQNGIALPPSFQKQGLTNKDAFRWQAIADIPLDEFEAHIADIKRANTRLTMSGAIRLANHIKTRQEAEAFEPPAGGGTIFRSLQHIIDRGELFATIYADPPWRYGNQGTRAATDDHYVTMTPEQICAEPVGNVVQDNAHLHLWTTNAFLRAAFDVIDAWGFTYKSCYIWVKPQMGIGNYWRVSHEFLLFGIRGKAPFRARDELSWGQFDRGEHSAKPDQIRQLVEKVSPGPYLEMYGREAPGLSAWAVYGNQVQRSLL
jgi:N6-adenosine-specific RNA methylase IME4